MTDPEALRAQAIQAMERVAQVLPGLSLTPLQEQFVLHVFDYERMRLEEGWVDQWIADLVAQIEGVVPGSP